MTAASGRAEDLREACIAQALHIIDEIGLERLSMRDVARRLGVSHQAPYKHFKSRDHILAEIIRRAFDDFADALRARVRSDNPAADFYAMGVAYIAFAQARPLYYRLMFASTLPEPEQHPQMMISARCAYGLLRDGVQVLFAARGSPLSPSELDLEALFAWSSLHGSVSLLRTDALTPLDLAPQTRQRLAHHALDRIGAAFLLTPPAAAPPEEDAQ